MAIRVSMHMCFLFIFSVHTFLLFYTLLTESPMGVRTEICVCVLVHEYIIVFVYVGTN